MNIDDAQRIERPPIEIGHHYTFFSTVQEEHKPPEHRLRNYTGKLVKVTGWFNEDEWQIEQIALKAWLAEGKIADDFEPEVEPIYSVIASDGFTFHAYQGELNGWFCDTGQFFWPDATYGPEHDPFALVNER